MERGLLVTNGVAPRPPKKHRHGPGPVHRAMYAPIYPESGVARRTVRARYRLTRFGLVITGQSLTRVSAVDLGPGAWGQT